MRTMMSATVTRGRKTNRVKRKAEPSPQRALRRYRRDPSTRGLDVVQVCISLPVAELAAIDEVAERVQMARSHFLRQAAKHFAVYVTSGTQSEQEKRWREALR